MTAATACRHPNGRLSYSDVVRPLLVVTLLAIASHALAQSPSWPLPVFDAPSLQDAGRPVSERLAPHSRTARSRWARLTRPDLLDTIAASALGDDQPDLALTLFNDASWLVFAERVERDALGHTTLVGHLQGAPLSSVSLVVSDGAVAGAVHDGSRLFTITGDRARVLVEERDRVAAGAELPPLAARDRVEAPRGADTDNDSRPSGSLATTLAGETGTPTVDVLLLYTPDARMTAGSRTAVEASLAQAIAESNTALQRSGVGGRFRTAAMMEVPYTQSSSGLVSDLSMLAASPAVATLRDEAGADVVALIVDRVIGGACGVAYVGPSPAFAFSVTARPCLTQFTLAHELAHTLGSDHAPGDSVAQGWKPYSYGYKDPVLPTPFRTIMAYPCAGATCPRVLQYSSPSVSYGQTARVTGTGTQNNAQSLAEAFPIVAQFRSSRSLLPEPPSGMRATLQGETVTLAWTGVTGATGYRLEAGTSPGASDLFSGDVGAGTSVSGRVEPGRYFARVRALRADLISPASAEVVFEIPRDLGQPAGPTGLTVVVTGRRVALTWTGPSIPVAGYLLEAGSAPGLSDLARVPVSGSSLIADGVPPGVYFVRVRALDAQGSGAASDDVRVVVP